MVTLLETVHTTDPKVTEFPRSSALGHRGSFQDNEGLLRGRTIGHVNDSRDTTTLCHEDRTLPVVAFSFPYDV